MITESIVFIDTEVSRNTNRIQDYGAIKGDGAKLHTHSGREFWQFVKGSSFICGHNIILHDLKHITTEIPDFEIKQDSIIDTLYWSPLLFPRKPFHRLTKDDKLIPEENNNPVNDSIKSRDLLYDEVNAFHKLPDELKAILFNLLHNKPGFEGFFCLLSFIPSPHLQIDELLKNYFSGLICNNTNLNTLIHNKPIELAYSLAIINAKDKSSITPPWVIKSFPGTVEVIQVLNNTPCPQGCSYCNSVMNPLSGLKKYFGFQEFRKFGEKPLQEQAVRAAIENKSLLAVFPTGGGKSLAFQLPALISGETVKGLTVVISPLQSLMKDQVDNLEGKNITEAVAISGLLDPIQRQDALNRVEDGSAAILYIAPESLRSASIAHRLIGRNIVRFVIDEAHCFSAWGHDFRVDYMYIGRFIKELQEKKGLSQMIPVSCFTATAKRKVIEDIQAYFKAILSLDLDLYTTDETRQNLHYKVIEVEDDRDKFYKLRDILERYECPSIVYVSRTKKAEELAKQLNDNGLNALPYHGKMDRELKTENQNSFMTGTINTMVATSAFGMGVDKDNVGLIIHYDISDSLENYIQEAGRAGRNFLISADCYILFNENDLSKHFNNHNRQKVNIKEIQQVWRAIRAISKMKEKISCSPLEIAREAGWDDNGPDMETRVLTALSALEISKFISRGQNNPRIFATSIQAKNSQEAIEKISGSERFSDKERELAIRIIKSFISSRSRKNQVDEVAESRIDYVADNLGIRREDVIRTVSLLKEEKILADDKDLSAYIFVKDTENKSLTSLKDHADIEMYLFRQFRNDSIIASLKDLNEDGEQSGCRNINPKRIKSVANFWVLRNWVEHAGARAGNNMLQVKMRNKNELTVDKIHRRHEIASLIVKYLFHKAGEINPGKEYMRIEFSNLELQEILKVELPMFNSSISSEEVDNALLFLSKIGAIRVDGGFLVIYNRISLERLEQNTRIQYRSNDYQQLEEHYKNKVQQIHIVGEYAKKMLSDYSGALQFVDDYFQLNYSSFLNKYFPGSKYKEISKTITPAKYQELMDLSQGQKEIVDDDISDTIVVTAGPGSGKTKLLVHKIASLILLEQFKTEQILVLTFSRAAAIEFQKRLRKLLGNTSYYIDIRTFHSFCFDLMCKTGTIDKSENIIKLAIEEIKSKEADRNKISRSVLVIDEAQDMSAEEYELIKSIATYNEEIKIIAVGDDDQNIYEFRGSDSKYFGLLAKRENSRKYELIENFRSAPELVELTNQFVVNLKNRLKTTQIKAANKLKGQIKIVNYRSNSLIQPITEDIFNTPLSGSTALLTYENDDAATATALLCKMGVNAKLIQSNDDFNLYNLKEIRWFCDYFNIETDIPTISNETWENSLREFKVKFGSSQNFDICTKLINDFSEINYRKRYHPDLKQYFREAKFEQVNGVDSEIVYVSTFHKSKGREFDNVFIMLENYQMSKEEEKRVLYVALTRAKKYLAIHQNGTCVNGSSVQPALKLSDPTIYEEPASIVINLTHSDVYLDHFKSVRKFVDEYSAGDELLVDGSGCHDKHGNSIIRFSSRFKEELSSYAKKGYRPGSARVKYCVYWKPKEDKMEYLIILPEIVVTRL